MFKGKVILIVNTACRSGICFVVHEMLHVLTSTFFFFLFVSDLSSQIRDLDILFQRYRKEGMIRFHISSQFLEFSLVSFDLNFIFI
jgi:glutathione peroxidase-family protein